MGRIFEIAHSFGVHTVGLGCLLVVPDEERRRRYGVWSGTTCYMRSSAWAVPLRVLLLDCMEISLFGATWIFADLH
jgi:hypothetical protein